MSSEEMNMANAGVLTGAKLPPSREKMISVGQDLCIN